MGIRGERWPSPSPAAARIATLIVVLALATVACVGGPGPSLGSSSAAPSSVPSGTSAPPTSEPSRSAPPAVPSSSGTATTGPAPSFPHDDAALEAYLPASLYGLSLTRFSMAGATFSKGGDMCILLCGNEPGDFARFVGVSIDQVTVGFAMAENGAIGAVAFRARGVDPDRLIPAGVAIDGAIGGGGSPSAPMTIAGHKAAFAFRLGRGQYLIADGEVLVFLFGEAPTDSRGSPSIKGAVPPAIVEVVEGLP